MQSSRRAKDKTKMITNYLQEVSDWENFDYLFYLNLTEQAIIDFNMLTNDYLHGHVTEAAITEHFQDLYRYYKHWQQQLACVDASKIAKGDRTNVELLKRRIDVGRDELQQIGNEQGYIHSPRDCNYSAAGELFKSHSRQTFLLNKAKLQRKYATFFDVAAIHQPFTRLSSARRKAFIARSKAERLSLFARMPRSMAYAELNRTYKKSITADFGRYIATIGGVMPPWNLFPKVKDSAAFAMFAAEKLYSNRTYEESPWKIHLSVQPSDLAKAWNCIYPILIRAQIPSFKVTRLAVTQLAGALIKTADMNILKARHFTSEDMQLALRDNERITKGMQITIYITKGEEDRYNQLLAEVEAVLVEMGIRPGLIDMSDRPIGIYSSVRHVGSMGYTTHDRVKAYKDIRIEDPFAEVPMDSEKLKKINFDQFDFNALAERATDLIAQCRALKQEYVTTTSANESAELRAQYSQARKMASEFHLRWLNMLQVIYPSASRSNPSAVSDFRLRLEKNMFILKQETSGNLQANASVKSLSGSR